MIDRLYLGGPTDLRGFGPSAAGPVENGTALGGNALWAAAVHAYRPLFPPRVLYAHAFAVAGNVVSTDGGSEWRELSQRARATCGVGECLRRM
jgi:outer membrane protein insertion porin family